MSKQEFLSFIERTLSQQHPPLNWPERRSIWLAQIEALYKIVEDSLADFLTVGKIEIKRIPMEVAEEAVGTYSVKALIVRIGTLEVRFVPVGTYIFGAYGRVDLIGSLGKARLILVEKGGSPIPRVRVQAVESRPQLEEQGKAIPLPELEWKFATLPPDLRLNSVNQESVLSAIIEVSNG